jgi:hypothetical protein
VKMRPTLGVIIGPLAGLLIGSGVMGRLVSESKDRECVVKVREAETTVRYQQQCLAVKHGAGKWVPNKTRPGKRFEWNDDKRLAGDK